MPVRQTKLVTLMILAAVGQAALAQGVGGSSPTDTSHVLQSVASIPEHPIHWRATVGSVAAPLAVELDPDGPVWTKHFQTQSGNPISQNLIVGMTEYLTVSGDRPWTGWRAEIMNSDFIWVQTVYNYPLIINANGSRVSADVQFSGSTLDATFLPIVPGTQVELIFEFARVMSNASGNSFDMHQYPVPEPVSLLSFAFLFLISRGRR